VPDVFSRAKRSDVMSKIRARGNRDTELVLASLLRRHRLSGWRRHEAIFGRPDFVFRKRRVILFVDGCFWHGCSYHANMPLNNREFWDKKLTSNKERDKRVTAHLRKKGWTVVRIWEHELKHPERVLHKISAALHPK
jgi:DNA mismatch endonuclease (patch repair protein)